MHLGLLISNTGLQVGSFRLGAEIAVDMGYDLVELGMNVAAGEAPCADLGACSPDEALFIAEDVRATGVDISAIQCHTTFVSPDEAERERNIELTKNAANFAADMRVPIVHTVSGPPRDDVPTDDAWAMMVEAYQDLIDHASAANVCIAIEPVFVYLVGNFATTKKLLDELAPEVLYINFDPSHFPYHRESPIPFMREFADRIVHAHAKDALVEPVGTPPPEHCWPMDNGEQFRFAPPGAGVLDWDAILAALREHGFDGALSLELGHGIDDPEQAARDNVTFFRRLLGQA